MWRHIAQDLSDAGGFLRCAAKGALATVFGRVTHEGMAITFCGTIYRLKRRRPHYDAARPRVGSGRGKPPPAMR